MAKGSVWVLALLNYEMACYSRRRFRHYDTNLLNSQARSESVLSTAIEPFGIAFFCADHEDIPSFATIEKKKKEDKYDAFVFTIIGSIDGERTGITRVKDNLPSFD